MTGLWHPCDLSVQRKASCDAINALQQARIDRVRDAERERGGITKDQIRDVLVLTALTEDLITGGDQHHRHYGLVAG